MNVVPRRKRMGLLTRSLLLSLIVSNLANSSAISQSAEFTRKQPRIALVLEGGAALGLAHIGVLQWLEEHRIPVSYVAGTSMGGLVGGMYATGYPPAGIREVVDTIDWNEVLRGHVP